MGIAGFQKWLEQHYPHCFIPVPDAPRRPAPGERAPPAIKDYFDHIYVDLNGYIHTVGRRAANEEQLFTLLFRELDGLFKVCVARQSIFIAIDGPASAAKLITQRKRRLGAASKQDRQAKAKAQSPVAESEPQTNTPAKKRTKKKGEFNLLQVTAGTPFMHRLKNALCFWACSRLQSDPKYHFTRIYISGPDVPGEGELKIMEFIVSHANADSSPPLNPQERVFAHQTGFADQERNAEKFRRDSHLIVGTDADLILLGLSSMLQNVFILNTQRGQSSKLLFSIWEFCRSLEQSFPFRGHCNMTRLDFVLISLLQGNDYLPKLRGASLDRLWARYKKLKQQPQFHQQFLVNSGYTLNVPFFLSLVCAFGPVVPLPSSPASSPNALPTSVPYSATTAAPAPVPVPAAGTIPFSAAAADEAAYPPALSTLFQSATQALGSFAPHHAPAHHHRGLHQQQQPQSPVDFVDPAIISSSSTSAFFPAAAGQLLPDDPSIIAASAMGYPAPYLHGGSPYYHPYHPPHPPVGDHPMPPAVALMFANPYLSASAFPSPVPVPTAATPPFGHGGHGLVAEEADIDAEGEVICFQPPVAAVQAAHLGEAQQHLAGEDLIGEAIGEDENSFDSNDSVSESESDYDDDDEEEEAVEGTNGKDAEELMEDDEETDDEEEEFIKGLIFGYDPEAYLQGLFWCLKMYMEGFCPDNKWFYTHRHAPTALQLRKFFADAGASNSFYPVSVPRSATLPLPPHKFCLTVLPLQARELAHELLQPYMALDSKLGSIFREPTLLVDVQLIDAVLSEIPEASLPPELRFAHTHYYQRAPHAGYGRNGWHPQPWSYQHQRYEHQPGPFVPSLLPQLPCQRYDPLWDPERRLKCAFYPTRSYPSPALYGGADPRVDLNAWPVLAPTVDHLRIPYYRPFAFLSMPYGGGGYRGGRGGGRGGRGGRLGGGRGGGPHVVGVTPLEGTIVASAPTDADAGGAPPPAGGFAPRPGRGGRGNRGGRGFARGGRGGAHAQHPQQHLPAEAAAAALGAPAELVNGGDAGPAAVAAEGPHRGGRGGRRGGRGGGRRGGRGGRADGGDGQPNPQHGDASTAGPYQPRATRGRARAPPVYKPKPSAGGPSPGAVVAVVPTTSGPQP